MCIKKLAADRFVKRVIIIMERSRVLTLPMEALSEILEHDVKGG